VGESTKYLLEPRIIGIVNSSNLHDAKAMDALADCETAEFRADGIKPQEIPGALWALRDSIARKYAGKIDIILTLRLRRDGGVWENARAAEREQVWLSLLEDPASFSGWLDVEAEEFPRLSRRMRSALGSGGIKVLLSHHDFQGCPPIAELKRQLKMMQGEGLSGFKVAVTCKSRREVLELLDFARATAAATPNAAVFSMGDVGRATRVLGPMLGCPLTYGYLTGAAVAPGQLSAHALRDFYRGLPERDWSAVPSAELADWADARLAEVGRG
jgi:3-dehydroquinate dehydratase type I